ncbi:MAG: NAD-dependent epimerase/dehydratase [Candidatus Magasanikbacteria bacterium GW2011_GWC2_40_17]|uniref:NAD-dependent epimerase/dehydratase n=1 Tax=Candidatus Magasanikbacteria bacterium GW2011_GWA2_42_32 TaxID=1619039 RepID=A0A0G1CFN7_9BACT|nr:MAG: NAD-dependent epimerase/dehydratase [Candidatus Magasanikbacteria bacterium GW2011_GWC2_40_17]KKS57386.1 MAG: NAD-dependent epimerase/dehydratase [Candidatus Magasanikbacteria bacterium GW2011_GWA2_42_32]
MKLLVTGSSGLIGSECVLHFDSLGYEVHGIDNNMRKFFFGEKGDTSWNLNQLKNQTKNFIHHEMDIRDREAIDKLFREEKFDAIIHCAAQPSHDKAKEIPFIDFEVNALGTLNLLEANRQHSLESPFIFMSTNKVYGDAPNEIPLVELETRWEYARKEDYPGVNEQCRIDQSKHSIFGASKVAADVMVQEYGRYFGMPTVCYRGGCLTGPQHSGVELHGFLSYLVKVAVSGGKYTVFGYKGKQVRDQIHSFDVMRAFEEFIKNPKSGAVYNLGGGRENNLSILEAFKKIEDVTGKKVNWEYVDKNREGDHICYISDLTKLKNDYPNWQITKSLDEIIKEEVNFELGKIK